MYTTTKTHVLWWCERTQKKPHTRGTKEQAEKKRRISSKGIRRENEGEEKEHIWREREILRGGGKEKDRIWIH